MLADYKDKEMSSFIIFPEEERGDKSKTGVYICMPVKIPFTSSSL